MKQIIITHIILLMALLSSGYSYAYEPNIISNMLVDIEEEYNNAYNNFKKDVENNSSMQANSKVIKTELPFSDYEKSAIKYNKLVETFKNGSTAETVAGLEKIIKEEPSFYQARLKLVAIKLENKQESEAIKLLEQGLELNGGNSKLIKILAKIKQDLGDLNGSLKELNKLNEQELSNEESQQMLAYNYYNLGFYDLAHKHYAQLVRHNSRNSKWWLGLAITQDTIGNSKNAIINYNKAKVIGGLEPEVLNYIEGRISIILTQNDKT
jgi:MSHA biogenesis protein MshN